jgi:predicted TIM-barrel fold metal-dependent hydrolase
MKERLPFVQDGPNGPYWGTKEGLNFGFANGRGAAPTLALGARRLKLGVEGTVDRMASTGLFDDGAKGIFRPTTPELRLKDQERDGVDAEVIYGLLGVGQKFTDQQAAIEFYRIYNNWLSDFCSRDLKRMVGLASIPSYSPEIAVAEVRRINGKPGIGGLDFSPYPGMQPLWHTDWDPLWRVAAELNLPVHFHTIGGPRIAEDVSHLTEELKLARVAANIAGFQLSLANYLASMIVSGAFERYPALHLVLGESGIGWIPYVLERMDVAYDERFKGHLSMKMKPSEYWSRQCRATFQDDPVGLELLGRLGEDNVMWGSDYPHVDGVWPASDHYIDKQFAHLPATTRRKITCDNAGKFYGLIH